MIAAYIDLAGRALLATVLTAAAVGKGRSREAFTGFAASLEPLRITGRLAVALAAVVVLGEAAAAALLLVPGTVTAGFALALAMFAAFTVVVAASVLRGTGMRCQCFGATGETMGVRHIVRNVVLTTFGAAAAAAHLSAPAGGAPTGGAVAAIGIAVLTGLAVAAWDDLVSVLGTSR